MHIGFTGTRQGMTGLQINEFHRIVRELDVARFAHGAAPGADLQAHDIIYREKNIYIEVWPATGAKTPDWDALGHPNYLRPAMLPLDRNKQIVNHCDLLIATPHTVEEQLRSGTWATIRYARKVHRPHYIIRPCGQLVTYTETG